MRVAALGHTVNVGNWWATVHYLDCTDYGRSQPHARNQPVSPGMRIRTCGHCQPDEDLVNLYLTTVGIQVNSHGRIGRRLAESKKLPE